jgi:hypothetical protein
MTVKGVAAMMQKNGPARAQAKATISAYKKRKKAAMEADGFAYPYHPDEESGIAAEPSLDNGPTAFDGAVASGPAKRRKAYEHYAAELRRLMERSITVGGRDVPAPAFGGSFEDKISAVREAIRNQSILKDVDIIATFDREAYVFDWRNKKYYLVAWQQATTNGDVIIGSMKEMEAKLVMKEQRELVQAFFREHAASMDPAKAPGLARIAGDLLLKGESFHAHRGRPGAKGGSRPAHEGRTRMVRGSGGLVVPKLGA